MHTVLHVSQLLTSLYEATLWNPVGFCLDNPENAENRFNFFRQQILSCFNICRPAGNANDWIQDIGRGIRRVIWEKSREKSRCFVRRWLHYQKGRQIPSSSVPHHTVEVLGPVWETADFGFAVKTPFPTVKMSPKLIYNCTRNCFWLRKCFRFRTSKSGSLHLHRERSLPVTVKKSPTRKIGR